MAIASPDMWGNVEGGLSVNNSNVPENMVQPIVDETRQKLSQLGEQVLIVSPDGNTVPALAIRAPEYDGTFGAEVYKLPNEHNKLYIKWEDGRLYPITLAMSERLIQKLFGPVTKEQFDTMVEGYVELGLYGYLYDLLNKEAQDVLVEIWLDEDTLAKFIAGIPPENIKKLIELIVALEVWEEEWWQRMAVGAVLWEAWKYQNPSDSLTKPSELAIALFDPNYNGKLSSYSLVWQFKELFKAPEKDLLNQYAKQWDELFPDSDIKGKDIFNTSLISKLGVTIGKNVYYVKYWFQEAQNRWVSKEVENLLFKYASLFYSSKLQQYINDVWEGKVITELNQLAQSWFGDLAYNVMLSTPSLSDKVLSEIEKQIYQALQKWIDPQHFESFELAPQEFAKLGENIKQLAEEGLLSAYLNYVFNNYDKLSQEGKQIIKYILGPQGDSSFVEDLLGKKIASWNSKNKVIATEANKRISDIVSDRKNAELDRKNAELDRKNAELDEQFAKLAKQEMINSFYKYPLFLIRLRNELPNYPNLFSPQKLNQFYSYIDNNKFYEAMTLVYEEIAKNLWYQSWEEFIKDIEWHIDFNKWFAMTLEESKEFFRSSYKRVFSTYLKGLSSKEIEFLTNLFSQNILASKVLYTLKFLQTNYPQLAQIWWAVINSYDIVPSNPWEIIGALNAGINNILKNPQIYPPEIVEMAQKLAYPQLTSSN